MFRQIEKHFRWGVGFSAHEKKKKRPKRMHRKKRRRRKKYRQTFHFPFQIWPIARLVNFSNMPHTSVRSIAGVCESVGRLCGLSIELHHSRHLFIGSPSSKESYTNIAPSVRPALSIELTEREISLQLIEFHQWNKMSFLYLWVNWCIDSRRGFACVWGIL